MASEEFGPYILEDVLGRGGMGVVYRAFDTRRDRTVALKRLPRHLAEDETFQARFRRESRMAARLNEPHIIPIHDFGEIDGQLYIDMRLVEGYDLSNLITKDHGLSPTAAVDVVGQIAAALSAAHTAGLVHRDIKPSNILVTGMTEDDDTMFAYLVDFGIARAMVGEAGTSLTATTGTVGTLAYMAPERISGAPGDSRSDIYSLACVLYECLVGRAPFLGEAFQVMFAHVNSEPPTASSNRGAVSADLNAVIRRGMAKEPDDRYQTATQFAAAARRALSDTGAVPRPVPLTAPPPPPTARPVDRTPPPSSQYGPARHSAPIDSSGPLHPSGPLQRTGSTGTSGPVVPAASMPGVMRPADSEASRPTFRTGSSAPPTSTSAPPTSQSAAPTSTSAPLTTPSVHPHTAPGSRTGPGGQSGPIGPPANQPPNQSRSFTDSGPIPPHRPAQRTSGGSGGNNRILILIAVAAVVVLIVGIVIVVAVRGGGSSPQADPTGSTSPSTSASPDFPSTSPSGSSSGAPSGSTSPTAGAGWAPYSQFTELIGATPGDTSTAYLGATCQIQPPDPQIVGMIDQVSCNALTGTKVVFYVARFSTGAQVTTYLDGLVKKSKYNRSYWTIGDQRRGLLVTSPTTTAFADVTSSICQLPTFLVQFYAADSAKLTEKQVEENYWKKSTFPNTTPTICK